MPASSSPTSMPEEIQPLTGAWLWIAAIVLALGNFVAVLDMTIANVSVATIAGNLGVSTSQGTWIITSYAVAEAIVVPLTGWLAGRFGPVKLFVSSMALFGLCSLLCGLSHEFNLLVTARIAQGLAGGPMMPMSQTLLLRIFPKEKAAAATGIWGVTTLLGPTFGPILGGVICDNWSWEWIFIINVPLALACSVFAWQLLKRYHDKPLNNPIDVVGLGLLVLWVGALQILLDTGKEQDWFASLEIRILAIVAVIGFIAFIIWELTEKNPVVNLRIFRYPGFVFGCLTLVLAFGGFFAINVTIPLWLQSFMGYSATWSGRTLAWSGGMAALIAPLAAVISNKYDLRWITFLGVFWMALITFIRSIGTSDMGYWDIAFPILLLGLGLPFFFMPVTQLILGTVAVEEIAAAAGLMNFLRTLAGAFAASIVNTVWENKIRMTHADLVATSDTSGQVLAGLVQNYHSLAKGLAVYEQMLLSQAGILATNQLMLAIAVIIFISAFSIWLAPLPTRKIDPSQSH